MTRTIVFLFFALTFTVNSVAQNISEHAIGLRLGDNNGLGTELSYQRALTDNHRLEFDFGWKNSKQSDGIKLTGLYQWVRQLDGNFNWFIGVGGGFASFKIEAADETDSFIFASGNAGIEYNFNIPLLLTLDVRPEIGFGDELYDHNDLSFDIALGIRY